MYLAFLLVFFLSLTKFLYLLLLEKFTFAIVNLKD